MSNKPKCNACGLEIHRDSGIAYMGDSVRHRHRSDCINPLQARIAELERRLEIDHAYDLDGNKLPFPEGAPDGISCRDETIKGLKERIAEPERENSILLVSAKYPLSGWQKAEADSEIRRAEGLFNDNGTLRLRVAELERQLAAVGVEKVKLDCQYVQASQCLEEWQIRATRAERQLAEARKALHASASLNADLDRQLASERAKVALAVEAAKKPLDMPKDCEKCKSAKRHANSDATTPGFFYTECDYHRNLRLIITDLIAALQYPDVLADLRREVARECAEIADKEAGRWYKSHGELAARMIRDAIRAKFGVTE